jgi:thiol-disulfide isomerase/thioredoxin
MAPQSPRYRLLWIAIILMPLLGIGMALLTTQITRESSSQLSPAHTLPRPTLSSPLVGQSAPNFELPLLDTDDSIRLSSLRGRLVFVNFWATWCEPCRREFPAFAAFAARQPDNGPLILAVNVGETPAQIEAFLEEIGVQQAQILLDYDFQVSDRYQVEFYPSTFVIDPRGVIAAFHSGEISLAHLEDYVAEQSQS